MFAQTRTGPAPSWLCSLRLAPEEVWAPPPERGKLIRILKLSDAGASSSDGQPVALSDAGERGLVQNLNDQPSATREHVEQSGALSRSTNPPPARFSRSRPAVQPRERAGLAGASDAHEPEPRDTKAPRDDASLIPHAENRVSPCVTVVVRRT